VSNASGKLVILAIIAVALAAAGTAWWFRYSATHRAVHFWGADAAQLIRDAPIVKLTEYGGRPDADFMKPINSRDISRAPGLVHLRAALLEDRSFNWPIENSVPGRWGWAIDFLNPDGTNATLNFTRDWEYVGTPNQDNVILSCKPISLGLRKFVDELPESDERPAR
jgi:hypothetical protein